MVYSYCKKHNPLFAYLPVESMIYKKQENYYAAINHSYYDGSSTEFIEFMLNTIKDALSEAIEFQSDIQSDTMNVTLDEMELLKVLVKNPIITQFEIAKKFIVTDRTIKRKMKVMQEKGLIKRENGKRNGKWVVLIKL